MKKLRLFTLAALCSGSIMAQSPETILTESWIDNSWENTSQSIYTYNSIGYHSDITEQVWDSVGWTNAYNWVYGYSMDGTLWSITRQTWLGFMWMNTLKSDYSYTEEGLLYTIIDKSVLGGVEKNQYKTRYTFDENENNTEMTMYYYDYNNAWKKTRRNLMTYNSDNLMTELTNQTKWMDWEDNYTTTISYNSANLVDEVITKSHEYGIWTNETKVVQYYVVNNINNASESFKWNTDTYAWDFVEKTINSHNSDETLYQTVYQIPDSISGDMTDSIRVTIDYLGGLDITDEMNPAINIFPNPTSDKLNIRLVEPGMAHLHMTNMEGKVVAATNSVTGQITLDIKHLAQGLYNLSIVQNGKVYMEQVVKK